MMDAKVEKHGNQYVLTFLPDTTNDKETIEEFGGTLGRTHMISCRGFKYLDAKVSFLIHPQGRSD